MARTRRPLGGQTLRAFYTRGFGRVWTGSMLWYSARWMDLFVLQRQVLVMTDSAFRMSLIGFYRVAPMFVFGLLAAQPWNTLASAWGVPLALTVSAGSGVLLLSLICWKATALRQIGLGGPVTGLLRTVSRTRVAEEG